MSPGPLAHAARPLVLLCWFCLVAMAPAQVSGASPVRTEHVVVVLQQNHTFDSYFGAYPGANGFVEGGVMGLPDGEGGIVRLRPYDEGLASTYRHARAKEPLASGTSAALTAYAAGAMDGFAVAQASAGLSADLALLYQTRDSAPALWALAGNYALLDNYFSSYMGESLPNSLYLFAGDDHGLTESSKPRLAALRDAEFPTVFDLLTQAGVSWKLYVGGLSSISPETVLSGGYVDPDVDTPSALYWAPVLAMSRFWTDPQLRTGIAGQRDFFVDAATGNLPSVSFVLPQPTDHPLTSAAAAENRLVSVVNAVSKGPAWESTVMFVVWDQWGGFYDHVAPPPGLGFRVPGLVISPFVTPGFVSSVQHDHTSILNFIIEQFGLPELSERQAGANGFDDVFDFDRPAREPTLITTSPLPPTPVGSTAQNRAVLLAYLAFGIAVGLCYIVLAWTWGGQRILPRREHRWRL